MHVQFTTRGTGRYASAVPGFEYQRATWEQVCQLGPQGWRLVAVPPVEPLYAMEREAASGARAVGRVVAPAPPR